MGSLADNAMGMYLIHYLFVVWLQYALLGMALFAVAKATTVFGGTLLLAWATAAGMRFVPLGSRLIGVERRRDAPSFRGNSPLESR
jgi:surface polysaccharide O-acyltransferase-like enzyme